MNLYLYIDESGTIPKSETIVDKDDCFVLGIIISSCPVKIRRCFRKGIVNLTNKFDKYKQELDISGEIKGSNVREKHKEMIFSRVYDKHSDTWELGIIRLHNKSASNNFRENSARAFNYLVWTFLRYYFTHNKILTEPVEKIYLTIDERNVASKSRYELEGYLQMKNFELSVSTNTSLFSEARVKYVDSSTESLVQMADMVANSYYRWLGHGESGSKPNSISMLETKLVNDCIFEYPKHYE